MAAKAKRSRPSRKPRAASYAAQLKALKSFASSCRTPQGFRSLVEEAQTLIPFQHLACVWGYPPRDTIRFIFNYNFPSEFLRWYLTKGMLWRSPVFLKWMQTDRSQLSFDVWRRLAKPDREILEHARRFGMKHWLAGGVRTPRLWIYFVMSMSSAQRCQIYQARFEQVVRVLAGALQHACPRPLLTKRESAILEHRTMGKIVKQIAQEARISERTVWEHLHSIKRKLYTDDLVNAVVIAVRNGLLVHTTE